MATEAQTNANRENARKSAGPRTPEDKTISSRNSLVHGMTSGKFLPPGGNPDEFSELLDQFRDRFKPSDPAEDCLVERMIAAEFKMRSMRYPDAGLFHYQAVTSPIPEQFNNEDRTNPMAWAFQCDAASQNSFSKLARYEATSSANSPASSAISTRCRMSAAPSEPEPPPAPKKENANRPNFPTRPSPQTAPSNPISP